jgi:hypothetical protein
VGNGAHYAAVRPDRDSQPVRRFECFTADLYRLAEFFVLSSLVALELNMSGNATAVSVGKSLAAVGGIGNMGTNLQFLTGYPLIALIAVNLARRHLDRKRFWNPLQPSQANRPFEVELHFTG